MKSKLIYITKIILAVIAGYAAMILGLLLSQDLTLGRVELGQTPFWKIPLVGIGSLLSAALGGWVAYLISKSQKLIPQIIMSLMTVFETIFLLSEGKLTNPLWFDLMSELVLILGILGGGYLVAKKLFPRSFSSWNPKPKTS